MKQKRPTISIQARIYNRLQTYCGANDVTVSGFCERLIKESLDRAERGEQAGQGLRH